MNKKNSTNPRRVVAFPHMGDYYIPAQYLFRHILHATIMDAPWITAYTLEVGGKYSPEFVCMPFKYTLGTFIECLDQGANLLIQAGGGCRYGYYSELQEQILKDLGYQFELLNFVDSGKTRPFKIYQQLKKVDPKFSIIRALYYLLITKQMIKYLDDIDHDIRANIGFEVKRGSFMALKKRMLRSFCNVSTLRELHKHYRYYKRAFATIPINKPDYCFKVGLIGELYTLMEPYANYQLEYALASYGISITRYTNAHYLLFEKKKEVKELLRYANEYVKHKMGADAADNIARAKYLCERHYDGIIHIKSSFCTPEIGAMQIINKVCQDYSVPILFFSFDSNTSEVGIQTRVEAFYDMIEMRRKHETMLSRD